MASTYGTYPTEIPDWNNLQTLHKNTLPPRTYFHSYSSEGGALSYDVENSNTQCLSGTWKFQHAYSPFEAPEGFEAPSFDTSTWSNTVVPGMWQLQGFGRGPQYTNVNFHIPVDPPNVSYTENETGSYVKKFRVPEKLRNCQMRLRFEGVDSSFHVWINGKEVGYSQGSRNPDEFDITDVVDHEGENILAVRVYQLCDGTYIEDQDQWWLSGIFRDVFLLGFPRTSRIEDLYVKVLFDTDYVNADLKVWVTVKGSGNLNIKLLNSKQEVVCTSSLDVTNQITPDFTLSVQNPLKWTAESPNLYHLVVSFEEQHIAKRIGFRQVEMKDGLIKVNGQRIVFRGVNRHEHHPKFGRAVPLEFMKQDLLTMKQHNINAIRTSHQINDPRLYDLADEMGFWVIDEADLECHGFQSIADKALSSEQRAKPFRERHLLTRKKAAAWTTDNPEWTHAYVDRAQHMVKRDQLHPSIIVWSLGNEAFFGRNFKAMYEWIKSYDDSRPIHYEADVDAETMDMFSRMYPTIDEIVKFGEDPNKGKPLVLCEFVHAMGNGPGNINEYVSAFYKYPKLQGGFAWEWANHGLLTEDRETGETFYAYGGDFGDIPNDSTFVMDGLVDSQHKPTPGLKEYKKAIEPVQLLEVSDGKARFISRYDFITLDHLSCEISINCESGLISKKETDDVPPGIGPGGIFEIPLRTVPQDQGEVILHVSLQLKEATPYLEAGFEVANAQIQLSPSAMVKRPASANTDMRITTLSRNILTIKTENSKWTFNTLHGTLTSWEKDETELISKAPTISFFRAQTDNDIPQDGRDWTDKLLHIAKPSTRKVEWSQPSSIEFRITVHQRVAPPVLSWSIDCILTYQFHANGSLIMHVSGTPKGENLPRTLPRIGLVMEMPKQFHHVQWWGRGPGESYRDSKLSQQVGMYNATVDELWMDYEVPQESSNRTDTRWLRLSPTPADSATTQHPDLFVQFSDGQGEERALFDFQASHYSMQDVSEAKHPHQLWRKKKEEVLLRLDGAHHGLGSGSCGPRTLDQYSLLTEPFEFEILLQ